MIHDILKEINLENGSKHKETVLKKYSTNEQLQRILKMALDKVAYTYGVSVKQVEKFLPETIETNLEHALDILETKLANREVTGNAAKQLTSNLIGSLPANDADLIKKIINRDLRINCGKSSINKVFKGLITKPVYKRCDTYSTKTAKNISFPAVIQLKADGTYREFNVDGEIVTAVSRSGESYDYPLIFKAMESYKDGFYMGELTVRCSDDIIKLVEDKLEKAKKRGEDTEKLEETISQYTDHKQRGEEYILPRSLGNGMINSGDVPHENLVLDLWEYVTPEEYVVAGLKDKKNPCTIRYEDSFNELKEIVGDGNDNIRIIEYHVVNTLAEALSIVSEWMKKGFEGGILKDLNVTFKDGTSKQQLKLKLVISAEMRFTGFTEGTGKNAEYFGAVTFENDEGTIKGKVGVSSMTEDLRNWMHGNRDKVIGAIGEIEFNDLSKAEGNDYWSLSHPRFVEIRNDKETTDTLEKVFKLREMAMELKAS